MKPVLKTSLTLLASAIALLIAPALRADSLIFEVDLNTALLSAQDGANAPFYLDLQLNYGGAPAPANTVTLSNFQFTGGSALGTATTNGLASGDLGSTVSLTADSASAFNELYQQFASTTTDIKFTATVSENGSGATPTEFTAAILDNSLGFPAQLYTNAPDTASLVTLNLTSSNVLSDVHTYSSVSSADGNTSVTGVTASVIPEPSTTAAVFGCVAAMLAFRFRRSRKVQML
jgi:hypothetical protein